jgi:hypothetical protein
MCVSFNNTQRRTLPYDEALSTLADKVKSYSGWPELAAGMKANNYHFEGVCPGRNMPSPIMPIPAMRGFVIQLHNTGASEMLPPDQATAGMESPLGDAITEKIILNSAIFSVANASEIVESSMRDTETVALMNTLALAYVQASTITLAVENAVKNDFSAPLEKFYEGMPQQVSLISELHTKATMAFKQGRDLNEAERQEFRDKIIDSMLSNPVMRLQLAKAMSQVSAKFYIDKAVTDINAGKDFTPPQRQPFNADYLKQRLDALPGNIGRHPAAQNYINYWQQQRTLDQDPMSLYDKSLSDLEKNLNSRKQEIQKLLKEQPAGPALQFMPRENHKNHNPEVTDFRFVFSTPGTGGGTAQKAPIEKPRSHKLSVTFVTIGIYVRTRFTLD